MNGTIQFVTFCDWLLSLRLIFLWLSHTVAHVSTSSFLMAEYHSILWYATICLPIHQLVELGFFRTPQKSFLLSSLDWAVCPEVRTSTGVRRCETSSGVRWDSAQH